MAAALILMVDSSFSNLERERTLCVFCADPDGLARLRLGFFKLGCGFTRTLSTAFEAFYLRLLS
jgi:hypothetical protein